MRVCFLHSSKPRERILAEAFLQGLRGCGDHGWMQELQPEPDLVDADVVCMVGVKSKRLFEMHARAGTHIVLLDKGYSRHSTSGAVRAWEFWRVAVDAHQPTHYLQRMQSPRDRWARLGLSWAPWRSEGKHIVFAGSSAKFHEFVGLSDPTTYARKVFKRLRQFTDRPIVYRPKPSWKDAEPIPGTEYSEGGSISDVLRFAHALVTHGSNACFEANLAGVPTIVLGDAVAKPISSTDLAEIESPRRASEPERSQWFSDLAYAQFSLPEFCSGLAWQHIRPRIFG